MSKDKNIQDDFSDDVWQEILKQSKPFLFKIPKWLPLSNLDAFLLAQFHLKQHFSDNEKILSLMDEYDKFFIGNVKFLMTKDVSDYPSINLFKEIPWNLISHLTTACWIRTVVNSGKKEGLSILFGNENVENIFMAEKVRKGGKKGHDIVHGNKIEQQEIAKEYQDKMNELHRQNRKLSYTKLSDIVGEYFDVTAKTIRNHTVSPKKKKK